ncbi:MAG TPA: hypothetical protein VFD74_03735 [Thermoleophilia bacterium]|nr:hypothetical protein [Thermoleophilia bacterium]
MIETAETVCPQCGALLTAPHQVDTFSCSYCGSSLRMGDGLRLYRLVERPLVSREAAAGFLRAWFAGNEGPADLETAARYELGGLRYFPFLRTRRNGADRVAPLAPLPSPEVMSLANVPAQLVAAGRAPSDVSREISGEAAGQSAADVPPEWAPLDEGLLRDGVRRASADPEAAELLIEQRAYYPVHYSYQGEHYSALVDAGAGRVLVARRPARREVLGERKVALGALALLFGEAVLVPGLAARIVVVVATAAGLYPLLRWALAHHG